MALAEELEPKLMGAEQAVWLLRLEAEHENLRAALEWDLAAARSSGGLRICTALYRFWDTLGHFAEGRRWFARVLGKPGAGERASERAKALNTAGVLALRQGDLSAARALYEESLAIHRKLGDRRDIGRLLGNLGLVSLGQGNLAASRTLIEESLATMRELGDRVGIANALTSLGNVAYREEDYSTASGMVPGGFVDLAGARGSEEHRHLAEQPGSRGLLPG